MLCSFAQHYGLLTGTAYAARPSTRFVNLSNSRSSGSCASSAPATADFFCIGDHHEYAVDADAVDAMLSEFLAATSP